MRRRASSDTGFIKAFLINLLFQFEWMLLALILFALHQWIGLPIWLFWAALGFWILLAFVLTWFMTWAVSCSDFNPGPGAKKSSERLRAAKDSHSDQKAS